MSITQVQIAHHKREGYVIAPHFFDAREVKALQAALQRLLDEGLLNNVATDGDGKTRSTTAINLQICPVGPHSELMQALPFCEKVRAAAQALIGGDVVHQLDQIFLKPPHRGVGTDWHQDNAYFKAPDPAQGLGMWIALHDATVENGTMHIVPRSHKKSYGHDRDPGSNHHIHCEIDEEKETVVPAVMDAGGVLFFNFGIAHCTRTNNSESERAGLALHFIHTSLLDTVRGKDNRPFLSGSRYSRGRNEFGKDMEKAWTEQVAALSS
jgi:ectoine hydroxylase-related dioxygenase (phytanoyl-CoA dioxygenase family)